jgi:effector-binding domain-containing protein
MKRRILVIVLALFCILVCVLLFAPISFGIKKQILINSPIIAVAGQITDLGKWPHWQAALKHIDPTVIKESGQMKKIDSWLKINDHEFTILQAGPANILVREQDPNKTRYHSVFVFPDSTINLTHVEWVEDLPFFNWVQEKIKPSGEVEESLANLKNYMEDPSQFYGFPLLIRLIPDSLFITKQISESKAKKTEALAALYKSLYEYAAASDLSIKDTTPRVANFTVINKDSIAITAGLSVRKKAPARMDISYMKVPLHGKALVGYYEGDYSGIQRLHTAMGKYLLDQHLTLIAAPYEKYLTNPKSHTDSLHMKIEIYYPVLL